MVWLGGVEVELHPKPYGQTTRWRAKVKDLFRDAIESIGQNYETDGGFIAAITPDFLEGPEKMFEALKAWEPGLDWEQIEETATDEEILTAFWEVAQMAYPLFRSLKASWMIETLKLLSGISPASTDATSPDSVKHSAGTSNESAPS